MEMQIKDIYDDISNLSIDELDEYDNKLQDLLDEIDNLKKESENNE